QQQKDALARRRKGAEPVKPWESRCPPRKGRLVIIAWERGTPPIYNLDHGTFVSHHMIGPQWHGGLHFESMTPNGDTTGPSNGIFKIIGDVNPDTTALHDPGKTALFFHVLKPNVGKSGRLLPIDGRSKIWATYAPFEAKKRLDIYCKVG